MAIEDIIPMDALFGGEGTNNRSKKKKKVDRIALSSPMMRIPRMDVLVARDLIDIGVKELYELQGRSAESLFEEIKKLRKDTPTYRLAYLRMAIYFAENDEADPKLLHPSEWNEWGELVFSWGKVGHGTLGLPDHKKPITKKKSSVKHDHGGLVIFKAHIEQGCTNKGEYPAKPSSKFNYPAKMPDFICFLFVG